MADQDQNPAQATQPEKQAPQPDASQPPAAAEEQTELTPMQIAQAAAHAIRKERPAPGKPLPIAAQKVQAAVKTGPAETSKEKLGKINREFKEKETARRARELGMAYINIAITPINPDLLRLIPPDVAKTALILPFFRLGNKLRVTVADPENAETKKVIEQLKQAGFAINVNLSSDVALLEAMRLYESEQYKVKKEITTTLDEEKIKAFEKEIQDLKSLEKRIKTLTSEEAVYLINVGALKTGASDIHFEPEEQTVSMRFRIDGILHKIFEIDKKTYSNIANQIKYQCKMKLNITNEPQDGRYSFIVNERKIDLRISVLPTEYGETFVCRLLDSERHTAEFEEMGFSGSALAHVKHILNIKNGMILITGPTGSGKTTTLYQFLDKFNKPENKVITLEDPIEYHLKGISQSQINEKRGYDFANGLRAILRQDPDIVMIGEIRDLETAETSAQAALTGHVLLSTLHTNSAIEAIPRLINIGLPPFMVAPALDTIIAQRLVRKFCPKCSELETVGEAKKAELESKLEFIKNIQPSLKLEIPEKLPVAKGCDVCSHTGYKGRIAVVEVLDVDNEMKRLILEKASSMKMIEAARKKGMLTMYEDGIIKVIQGLTSLTEVHRVTAINV
ncbi:Flp pilus assembly complex ATPase component TadA [Patescibacteria group bacterium]|nr:Flp pilus assembly complex ATPase component TadA [Patescibacteria group bacterium]MBU1954226.1 Flp pilus assembly complex ATPase component TadA [Patescibacteria group bacterium]